MGTEQALSLVQLLNYSKAAEAQVAKLQMAKPGAGRQHPANCRHCHVRCHSVADRACGACRRWQQQECACVWYYSSGLMRDKTKPENIVIVKVSASNATWRYCRISAGSELVAGVLCHNSLQLKPLIYGQMSEIPLLTTYTFLCLLAWCSVLAAAAAVCGGQQGQTKTASCTANERQSSREGSRDIAGFRELNTNPTGSSSNYQTSLLRWILLISYKRPINNFRVSKFLGKLLFRGA